MASNNNYNNRPYSTLHSPDEYSQPQPSPYSNSLHTPVDAPPTPSFPPSPQHAYPVNTTNPHAYMSSPPPQHGSPAPRYMTPPTQPVSPVANPYYLPPPSAPSHTPSTQHYYQPQTQAQYSTPALPSPGMASTPAPTTHTEYYSPPASPGLPPPSTSGAVEEYQMQPTSTLHTPHPSSPPPSHDFPPPPAQALDSNPAAPNQRRPPIPPEPIFTPSYNPSSTSSPTTPKTPVYTPAAAAGPNGGVHAPGQIAHPNQQHNKETYHHGLCDCFSDISSCCWGYWCPCVLYSRTYHRLKTAPNSNLKEFSRVNGHCLAFCAVAPVSWVLTMLQRTRIREEYRLQGSMAGDCARAYCCVMCTLVQDEREVRDREDERRRFAGPGSGVVGDSGYRRQTGMVYQ